MSQLTRSPSDDIRFRFACEDDIGQIVGLLANDPLGAAREATGADHSAAYRHAFREMEAQDGNRYLVAESGGEIVGCLQVTFIPGLSRSGMKRAQLEGVRVSQELRGAGLGGRLIREAIAIARAEGCGIVQLTTDKQRPEALEFYKSLGFVESHLGLKFDL